MMKRQVKPIGVYCAWGAFFAVLSGLLQLPLRNEPFNIGQILGGGIGGAFLGALVWWWRSRYSR